MIKNKIFCGHVLEVLKSFPCNCIDAICTSPPYYCYSDDTEILTRDGWKNIKDVNKNEFVLTVNPHSNELEYNMVTETFSYEYAGKLKHFIGENIDLKVTSNHNLFVKPYSVREKSKNGKFVKGCVKHVFRRADQIEKQDKIQLRGFGWNGVSVRTYTVGDYVIPIDLWLSFLGWWVSGGSVDGGCGGEGRVSIKQKVHWKEVNNLLSKLPFKFNVHGETFEIYDEALYLYLKPYGDSYTRYMPEFIKDLTSELINIFWKSYMMGSGHGLKSSYSVSKKLNDNLQEMALKLGYNSKICGNIIRYKTDMYIRPRDFVKDVDYNGMVYCVTTINHTLITRRNGVLIVCGNSQRFYGKEINTVWDETVNCEHLWEYYVQSKGHNDSGGILSGKQESAEFTVGHRQGFCVKCGAWYGQLGQEPTPSLYIKHLVDIFREARRVLKSSGLFFLNIGDTFAGSHSGYGTKIPNPFSVQSPMKGYAASSVMKPPAATCVGKEAWLKPKQLMLIPSRLAIALQEDDGDDLYELREDLSATDKPQVVEWLCKKGLYDKEVERYLAIQLKKKDIPVDMLRFFKFKERGSSWLLRSDIIWEKKSHLPIYVLDNFDCSSYEHIFMFAKAQSYFFDTNKARKPYSDGTVKRQKYALTRFNNDGSFKCAGTDKDHNPVMTFANPNHKGVLKGNIWRIGTSNSKIKHFASFSEELVEECIVPGCSKEVCVKCGAPKIERYKMILRDLGELETSEKIKYYQLEKMSLDPDMKAKVLEKMLRKKISLGFIQNCKCEDAKFEPGIVLDPFMGSGTTAAAVKKLGYYYCGIEFNSGYVSMINKRLSEIPCKIDSFR